MNQQQHETWIKPNNVENFWPHIYKSRGILGFTIASTDVLLTLLSCMFMVCSKALNMMMATFPGFIITQKNIPREKKKCLCTVDIMNGLN